MDSGRYSSSADLKLSIGRMPSLVGTTIALLTLVLPLSAVFMFSSPLGGDVRSPAPQSLAPSISPSIAPATLPSLSELSNPLNVKQVLNQTLDHALDEAFDQALDQVQDRVDGHSEASEPIPPSETDPAAID